MAERKDVLLRQCELVLRQNWLPEDPVYIVTCALRELLSPARGDGDELVGGLIDGEFSKNHLATPTPPSAEGEKEAFERVVVNPLYGRYDAKDRIADFAMFSLGYRAAAPVSTERMVEALKRADKDNEIASRLLDELEEARSEIAFLLKKFDHTWVDRMDGTDTCAKCGIDIRHDIHRRVKEVK